MNLPDTGSVKTLHEQMDILARAILTGLDKLLEADRNQATALRLDFFAAKWLKIRTKKAGPAVPFALNWVQADFLKRLRRKYRLHGDKGIDRFRGIRANVLKPRQLGFSTFIAATSVRSSAAGRLAANWPSATSARPASSTLPTGPRFFSIQPRTTGSAVDHISSFGSRLRPTPSSNVPSGMPSIRWRPS